MFNALSKCCSPSMSPEPEAGAAPRSVSTTSQEPEPISGTPLETISKDDLRRKSSLDRARVLVTSNSVSGGSMQSPLGLDGKVLAPPTSNEIKFLPPGAIAAGTPSAIAPLPRRPPGQQSPISRYQNIFHGTRLTITKADELVLPHVLHHMTDSGNDESISKNGFDQSKAKEDPENRFAFDPSGATKEEQERHTSRSRSVFFGLGESDRQHMQTVKREDKELYGVDTSIHHAMFPSTFSGKLVQDEVNPPGRNYHRMEGSVPATCLVSEPVESRPLALQAIDELIKNAGYTDVSPSQVKNYMAYLIEKFDDELRFQAGEA